MDFSISTAGRGRRSFRRANAGLLALDGIKSPCSAGAINGGDMFQQRRFNSACVAARRALSRT